MLVAVQPLLFLLLFVNPSYRMGFFSIVNTIYISRLSPLTRRPIDKTGKEEII